LTNFIIRRLIISVFIIILLSIATFALLRVAPGDAALLSAGGGFIPREQVEAAREELGLNKPYFPISFTGDVELGFIPVPKPPFIKFNSDNQYWDWAGGVLRGDLGRAQLTKVPVTDAIKDRLPTTLELLVLTMITTILIGIPAGVLSALYRNSAIDFGIRFGAILALSIPAFWLATMVLIIPSELWGYAPPLGETISLWENPWDNMRQFLPPAIVLGTAASASVMRLTRSSLLEVMRSDYIRTARAKGLRDRLVVYRHALKNVMIPVITVLGLQFTGLLGGTLFIELIFSIKGLGLYTFEAIFRKDFTVVQSMTLYIGVVVILTQLVIDISYAWIDPRIRYS
jgi:peptide/nickel transport system permease protein